VGAELVLHLPERIDVRALAWLGRRIPDAAGFGRVVLDFSAVRECQSFALVALMTVARQIQPRRIHTRGFNARQVRVVQNFDDQAPALSTTGACASESRLTTEG
jgi:hypothetical protein